MLHRILIGLTCLPLLQGCSDQDAPLEGKRESIFASVEDRGLAASKITVPMELDHPRVIEAWTHQGLGPDHHIGHGLVDKSFPRLKWQTRLPMGRKWDRVFSATPVVDRGTLYVLDTSGTVTALDGATGALKWEKSLLQGTKEPYNFITGSIMTHDGRVYVTPSKHEIICLKAADGTVLWRRELSTIARGAPTYHQGRLYVITTENHTDVLDAVTGKLLWTHNWVADRAALLGTASPAIKNHVAVVPYSTGDVFAFDLTKTPRTPGSNVLWQKSMGMAAQTDPFAAINHVLAHPVIHENVVYTVNHAKGLSAMDLASGGNVWQHPIPGIQMPMIAGNALFTVSRTNTLYALHHHQGGVYWSVDLPIFEDEVAKRGKVMWFTPLLASGRLYVTGSHGDILVFCPKTGKKLARLHLTGAVSVPPILVNKVMYVLTDDGDVVAYE